MKWQMLGVVSTAVIVLTIPLSVARRSHDAAPSPKHEANFVGREKCKSCHEAAFESWLGSDHDKAMDVANEVTVLGDFNDVVFTSKGMTSRFFRRGEKFFVNTEGPNGEFQDFEITHTFGVEPLQQYLVPFPGGRLQCLTIAWDKDLDQWFDLYPDEVIPPDDWMHWTRAAMNWNGMCAECHSTNLIKAYDSDTQTYDTSWSEIDVSCEACHGPGSVHVQWASVEAMARRPLENFGLVVPTANLSSPEQVELCAPCHSRRGEMGDYDHRGGALLDKLRPSVLEEGLYHADGQILDEVYVWGSFTQSKMYANDVRCSDCHNVHSLKLHLEGNALCGQCHRMDVYDSYDHHFHKKIYEGKASDGALCIKCHMPEQTYMGIDERADHSIRIPRPDLTLSLGAPNACNQTGCHVDKSASWSDEHFKTWYGVAKKPHYGTILAAARRGEMSAGPALLRLAGDALYPAIVRASALSLLGRFPGDEATAVIELALSDEDPLLRHTAVLSFNAETPEQLKEPLAPLLFDPVRSVRIQAATRLADLPSELFEPYQLKQREKALDEYIAAMEQSLDFAVSNHNLGNLYTRLNEATRAIEYYQRAIEVDDLFFPAKLNLAVILSSQGRNEEAEVLLRDVVRDYPEQFDAIYSLGLLVAEMGRYEEAAIYLRRAAEAMPDHPRVHQNLREIEDYLARIAGG